MDQRPGTSSGRPVTSAGNPSTTSDPFRRHYAQPSSSAYNNHHLPDPSAPYGPPSTGYGPSEYGDDATFGRYPPEALYEEDEEDESSDDGGIFAYLPPTTAEQQLEQEQQQQAHPPPSSDSRTFQYSSGDTGTVAHVVPEGELHSYPPQYPGTETSPSYPHSEDVHTQPTEYDNISQLPPTSLQRNSSFPPSARPPSRAPQAFSHIPFATKSPTSPSNQDPSPQQSYAPGDVYRMREIQPPPSATLPSTAEYTRNHQPSSTHPSPGGTGAAGRVSITTHPGVTSRSREVHVTLPPSRTSPPSDVDIGVLPSPEVAPGVLQDTHVPARTPTLAPSTPVSDIDRLYYDDTRKDYSRQTTGDSSMQPRKRRRQKTASSTGISVDDEYDDYIYGDEWAHHPGMSIKDDKGAASSSYSAPSMGALEEGSPHHGHRGRGMAGATHDHRTGTANSNGGLGEGQVVNGSYILGTGGLEDDDEDSPYPEVRASVSNIDDPEMPVLTLRMWILGLSLCIAGAGANTFFNFRYPAPTIAPLVLLLVAHPCGKFLAYTMPIESFVIRIPRWILVAWWKIEGVFTLREWRRKRREGVALALTASKKEEEDITSWDWEIHLNPGPFNIKVRSFVAMLYDANLTSHGSSSQIIIIYRSMSSSTS